MAKVNWCRGGGVERVVVDRCEVISGDCGGERWLIDGFEGGADRRATIGKKTGPELVKRIE